MASHPIEIARKILTQAQIPFCLMASTLLGIYRDGQPLGPIFEFAVLADDINSDKIEKLGKLAFITAKRQSDSGLAIIDLGRISDSGNNFELHLVYFKNGYGFHNLSGDSVLVWPAETWKKKNWGKVEWGGKEWNTPGKVESYLAMYYGINWRTPQPFAWGDAPNHFRLDDINNKKIWFGELTAYNK